MIEIIPAMDLIGGRCVRLLGGDFAKETVYSDDPVAVASEFAAAGLKRLHMVDLDGARGGSMVHLDVLRDVASQTHLTIDYSGGIRTDDDVQSVLDSGARIVTVGSVAVRSPEVVGEWSQRFGAGKLLVGVDVRDGNAATNGWQRDTTKTAAAVIDPLFRMGLSNFFVTDISKDGGMSGPALDLYRSLLDQFPDIRLTASGGVRNMDDVASLDDVGCEGVIIGRALYEGKITIKEAAAYAR